MANYTSSTGTPQEGVTGDFENPLALSLEDSKLLEIIGNRIESSKSHWNSVLNLDSKREQNEKYWLNDTLDESKLYEFQIPYKNNRVFIDIETLVSKVTENIPVPQVTEANDTDASRELAHEIEIALTQLYDELFLKKVFGQAARHLLMGKRLAILKYRFDGSLGDLNEQGERKGQIIVETVAPEKFVLDKSTKDVNNPPLTGEYMTATLQELQIKFPDKTDEITAVFGKSKQKDEGLATEVTYLEIWFSYYDDKGEKQEGVCWKYRDLLLGKMKNPHYIYETSPGVYKNFFKSPQKPYILINYLNSGRYAIDDTSPTDQAAPQQDILNKRGRQIVENADSANSGTIWNEQMIKQDDVAKLTGSPNEKAMVNGPVTQAATRLPINILPDYVILDKNDAKNDIDNFFGAHAPLKGEGSTAPTLGQDMISQNQDMTRIKPLADALEDGASRLYQGLTQMMKVFWDEKEMIRHLGSDGKTTFVEFNKDNIEDGIAVRVKSGSMLPRDKNIQLQITMKLAAALDPLTIAQGLQGELFNIPPKEMAKRMVYYKADPAKYISEILGEDINAGQTKDTQALQDIQALAEGKQIQPPANITKEYVATLQNYVMSPEFKQLDPQVQQSIIAFAQQVAQSLKGQMNSSPEQAAPQGAQQLPPPQAALPSPQQPPDTTQGFSSPVTA